MSLYRFTISFLLLMAVSGMVLAKQDHNTNDVKKTDTKKKVSSSDKLLQLNQRPATEEEWGYRPFDQAKSKLNPPSFVWRPMKDIVRWELEIRDDASNQVVYQNEQIEFAAHTPPVTFDEAGYSWRYRGYNVKNQVTNWSTVRRFTIEPKATPYPLPLKKDLLSRIPVEHPRVFVRPESIPLLKEKAKSTCKTEFDALVKYCDGCVRNPPSTEEPPLYPDDEPRRGEKWRVIWWGNRVKTIATLEPAATCAFMWNLTGKTEYAELAKQILLACAKWDPKGATGFRYNDEAGMPFNYHFSRTYTFLHNYLTEQERDICRQVMRIRGEEMFSGLFVRRSHFWTPYGSHSNRAWHWLGEMGIAFYNEIPEAANWVWYAMNVFYGSYPVWSDDEGGWHEGVSYWQSYLWRFLYWADIMKTTFDIDAFQKPYFSQAGYYALYLMPPNRIGGTIGDLCYNSKASSLGPLLNVLAMQAENPYWKWYSEKVGVPKSTPNYYSFLRNAKGLVQPKEPTDLPTSRVFWGTGQAMLNTNLLNANDNTQLVFKSSPFGGYSHGYDASNSFFFSAWNENLLINTGRRDIYGSDHHKNWMWSTRSVNSITVNGKGQYLRSLAAKGKIVHFETTADYDYVVGEAAKAYPVPVDSDKKIDKNLYPKGRALDRFTRSIVLFKKENTLVIYDQLVAPVPSVFDYWLHSSFPFQPENVWFPDGKSKAAKDKTPLKLWRLEQMRSDDFMTSLQPLEKQHDIVTRVDKVACRVDLVFPKELRITQTNQYDPNPRPRIKDREFHLTFSTTEKAKTMEFLAVVQAWKVADKTDVPRAKVFWKKNKNGLRVKLEFDDGTERSFMFKEQ